MRMKRLNWSRIAAYAVVMVAMILIAWLVCWLGENALSWMGAGR